ncbi:hypothetical protein KFL_005160020, partial [Klebsormidium nitens]
TEAYNAQVKKKTARQKVKTKLGSQSAVDDGEAAINGDEEVSLPAGKSAQRRLAKKLKFHKNLVSTKKALSATRTLQKPKKRKGRSLGLALENLSTLVNDLPAGPSKQQSRQPKILRSKARQDITTQESKQLAAVLDHPTFKANPFEAIRQHLTNTVPPPPPAPKPKRPTGAKRKRDKKKKARAEDGMDEEMDML